MSAFLTNLVGPALISGAAGVVAWIGANFFAAPLIEFRNLRKAVHQSLFYNANVGVISTDERISAAMEELRRYAATLNALWFTAPLVVKKYLLWSGYDIDSAGLGLTGLSNSLHLQEGSRAIHRHRIEKGLRLPMSYTDAVIREVIQKPRS